MIKFKIIYPDKSYDITWINPHYIMTVREDGESSEVQLTSGLIYTVQTNDWIGSLGTKKSLKTGESLL